MASNSIGDEGAEALAGMLRANRQIRSLTLADNWVTDKGLGHIVQILGRFVLRHEEVVSRRRRVIDQLKKKFAIVSSRLQSEVRLRIRQVWLGSSDRKNVRLWFFREQIFR